MITVDAVLNLFSIEFEEESHLRRSCALPKPNQLAKLARAVWKSQLHHRPSLGGPTCFMVSRPVGGADLRRI